MATYQFTVKFKDNTEWSEEISSIDEAVWPKKGFDYNMVDTKKFSAFFIPYDQEGRIGITEYKKGFKAWLDKNSPEYVSVVFKKVD